MVAHPSRRRLALQVVELFGMNPAPELSGIVCKTGLVRVDKYGGQGHVLFTERFLFAFRTKDDAAMALGMAGGAIGRLVGAAIDSGEAAKTPPEHLNNPELAGLDSTTRKRLLATELLCVVPLGPAFAAKQTALGFTFMSVGHPTVSYKGLFQKKSIRLYLQSRNIPILR